MLHNLGYKVSGSDLGSNAPQRLAGLGVTVHLGHQAENVSGADVVVTSTAVNEANPEVVAARANKTPIVRARSCWAS
ncbi:Mur ligase domain-containing protein [Massilia oculi]|uniref:Mur ligase domain-containing protein n=1 Tax=Massilia oculi TaxID=945844 RepID=UPI0036240667